MLNDYTRKNTALCSNSSKSDDTINDTTINVQETKSYFDDILEIRSLKIMRAKA